MNLLETILAAGGGSAITDLSRQFGTQPQATQSAVTQIVDVLSKGLARNTATPSGLEGLLGALAGGNHQRYVEDLSEAVSPTGVSDGNGILGHILGSKDVSRELAARVGANAGLDSSIIKKMLPVIATMLMGALSKRQSQGGLGSLLDAANTNAAFGNRQSPLNSILDMNQDGSIADDIINLAGKFLR
jgi:hypothetical protein